MTSAAQKKAPPVVAGEENALFSIPFHVLKSGIKQGFDLYSNFSGDGSSSKFMKVFPKTESLEEEDLDHLREKYLRLYVLESQRSAYLLGIANSDSLTPEEKTTVLKATAIGYLDRVFSDDAVFSNQVLNDTIQQCHDAVEAMVDVVQDFNVTALQEHIAQLSFHDFYTYDHSINVSMYCISFFKFLNPSAPKNHVILAGLSGMLHDIGKIKIPTSIINNPGKLDDKDFQTMMEHPHFGATLLDQEEVSVPEGIDLATLRSVVFQHHENWDGSGYPGKINGENIHPMARITAICDFFDAITTKRAYHNAVSTQEALDIMSRTTGKKLDARLFAAFCQHCGKIRPSGRGIATLADDFDPCRPHKGLPLKGFRHK